MTYINMAKKTNKRFKAIEKDTILDKNDIRQKKEDLEWEGEDIQVSSGTDIREDTGVGQAILIRSFEFGANVAEFKKHKPTAQELFNHSIKFMETELWKDGYKFYTDVEPRLQFRKDNMAYRFFIAAIPQRGQHLNIQTNTLSQLLTNSPTT